MRTSRLRSATRRESGRERGAVLVVVLVMTLLFATVGGAGLLITGSLSQYQKNRELAAQAFYAAEAGLHTAVVQLMASSGLTSMNKTPIGIRTFVTGYAPTMAAIVEEVSANSNEWKGRIYARGAAGGDRVVKFLRAYVKITKIGAGGTMELWDWQEITRATVVAHRDALPDSDPNKSAFTSWL